MRFPDFELERHNARLDVVEDWFAGSGRPDDLVVVADSRARGILPRASRADRLRPGADVAVRHDGEIALLHLASGPDDRVPVEELLPALRTTPSAAPSPG